MYSHHHSEPESDPDVGNLIRNYWQDPGKTTFETEIVEINETWVRLKENYFYPEGGGQASDRGILKVDKTTYKILDVQERDKAVWLNVGDQVEVVGKVVKCEIDGIRRIKLSRNHSAQHLLSAGFWNILELETISADIKPETTLIDLNGSPKIGEIINIFDEVNQKISENIPISSNYYSPNEIDQKVIRGRVGDLEVYRIVSIGNYDQNACGGTHVATTGEIHSIVFSKLENKRIRFLSGLEALTESNHRSFDLLNISRSLGVPINRAKERFEEFLRSKIENEKHIKRLREDLVRLELSHANWVKDKHLKKKIVKTSLISKPVILEALGELPSDHYVVCYMESGNFMLTSSSEQLSASIFSQMKKLGIKGGGTGSTIMGKSEFKTLETMFNSDSAI